MIGQSLSKLYEADVVATSCPAQSLVNLRIASSYRAAPLNEFRCDRA